MKRNSSPVILFFFFFSFFFIYSHKSALAYLDPGSANSIIQIIVAAIATVLATIKIYWIRIKSFFYKITQKKKVKRKK